jgi:hypothetical protein
MAQTLEHNKAVTTVVPVSIPTFDDDLAIIQKLDDEPNDVGGLTAMELKAKFDEGNVTAQQYINNVLIPAVVADDLTEQTRAAAEAERVANEIERVASETSRLSAENARITAEANRVIAEAAREQAEQARVNSTTGIVAQATAKANEATAAASAAAQDASSASTSAESARSASGIASSASNAAQAAATSASASASTASSAANRASASESSAASSAETAKRYAEQASSAGAGDMLQSVYDPTYKRQDIFKYVDTKVSNIPTPDVSGQISAHNNSTSAHADIRTALNGKAPAGYGLGSDKGRGTPDCNTAIKSGWYYTGSGTANGPVVNGVEQLYLSVLVSAREEFVDQIAFGHYQGNHLIWRRYSLDTGATWSDWKKILTE